MSRRLFAFAVCLAAAAAAQSRFDNELTVLFEAGDGALNIHTESTLKNAPRLGHGVIAISEGEISHRMVMGRDGEVLLAYNISMSPNPDRPGAYDLHATPAPR